MGGYEVRPGPVAATGAGMAMCVALAVRHVPMLYVSERMAPIVAGMWIALGCATAALGGVILENCGYRAGLVAVWGVGCVSATVWVVWAAVAGLWPLPLLVWLAGTVTVTAAGWRFRSKAPASALARSASADPRDRVALSWQATLNRFAALRGHVYVMKVAQWSNGFGEDVAVHLCPDPTAEPLDPRELAGLVDRIAQARHVPTDGSVTVRRTKARGIVILSVMRQPVPTPGPETLRFDRPGSINDRLPILWRPDGKPVDVCLRENGALVFGATGTGKSTFMQFMMLKMGTWVDTLLWVIDLKGGAIAGDLIADYLAGNAEIPMLDWVASDPVEAIALAYVAAEIAADRGGDPKVIDLKARHNTRVVPVSADLPAIMLCADEGAELEKAHGRVGARASEEVCRAVRTGRAEGVRALMSVLRGTRDSVPADVKVNAPYAVTFRVNDAAEACYSLDVNKITDDVTGMPNGRAFARRPGDGAPVLASSINLDVATVRRGAVECQRWRPLLNDRARDVAARATVQAVFGKLVEAGHIDPSHPTVVDVIEGRLYEYRWARYAYWQAVKTGDVDRRRFVRYLEAEQVVVEARAGGGEQHQPTGSVAGLLDAVGLSASGAPQQVPQPKTTRDRILGVVAEADGPLTRSQILTQLMEAGHGRHSDTIKQHLADLVAAGDLERLDGNRGYRLAG
jgi:hypothetical protein